MPDHRADWLRAASAHAITARDVLRQSRDEESIVRAIEALRALDFLREAEACLAYAEGCDDEP